MPPSGRYDALVEHTTGAVTRSPGHTSPRLRRALVERTEADLPAVLADYVRTVRAHAYRVTDEQVQALKAQGYQEDEIFELTAATALGAALHRLERGMAALREDG